MSWTDTTTTRSRERSICAREGCTRPIGPNNRTGHCNAHAPRPQGGPAVGDTTVRARAFVRAWLQASVPDRVQRALPAAAKDALADRVAELLDGQGLRYRVPSAGTKVRQQLDAGLIRIGTPRQLSPALAADPDMRCPECPAYTLCLEHVLRQGWQGWTCRGCAGPGVEESKQGTREKQSATMRAKHEGGG